MRSNDATSSAVTDLLQCPQQAPDFRSLLRKQTILNFRAILALFVSDLLWKTLFFYSFILAGVKLTHARSLATVKFQGLKMQLSSFEGNTVF